MKIYTSPFSSNARKVIVTAAELALAPELITVDLPKGEQRKPEFLALNPSGKVPVLVDGDFVLTESHAIMMYLADKAPNQKLYPTEPRARADSHRWLFWSANHFGPAIATLNFEHMVKKIAGLGEPDPALIAHGEALFHESARILDAHLATREWLVGSSFTLADIAVGVPLVCTQSARLPVQSYAHIEAWFGRIQQRDSWKQSQPRDVRPG